MGFGRNKACPMGWDEATYVNGRLSHVTASSTRVKVRATVETTYGHVERRDCIGEVVCDDVVYAVDTRGRVALPNRISVPDPHKLRNLKIAQQGSRYE